MKEKKESVETALEKVVKFAAAKDWQRIARRRRMESHLAYREQIRTAVQLGLSSEEVVAIVDEHAHEEGLHAVKGLAKKRRDNAKESKLAEGGNPPSNSTAPPTGADAGANVGPPRHRAE